MGVPFMAGRKSDRKWGAAAAAVWVLGSILGWAVIIVIITILAK